MLLLEILLTVLVRFWNLYTLSKQFFFSVLSDHLKAFRMSSGTHAVHILGCFLAVLRKLQFVRCYAVNVLVAQIVFSILEITSSGDHTRPQHLETHFVFSRNGQFQAC